MLPGATLTGASLTAGEHFQPSTAGQPRRLAWLTCPRWAQPNVVHQPTRRTQQARDCALRGPSGRRGPCSSRRLL